MSTSNSRRLLVFTINLLSIFLITLVVNAVLLMNYRQNNLDSYVAAVFDKQALLSSTPSPKIILVGGSNVAFGFDSRRLSEGTGLPVVNAGLQGGLGLHFMLNSIKPSINRGDIVLLSPEYHILFNRLSWGEVLAQMLVIDPGSWKNISTFNEVWQLLKTFPTVHTEAIRNRFELEMNPKCQFCKSDLSVYSREAFDPETGDITTNQLEGKPEEDFSMKLGYALPNFWIKKSIRSLNRFNEYVVAKGATLFFVYPNTVTPTDAYTRDLLNRLDAYLQAQLDFPVLDTPSQAEFAKEYMFDTPYHLNSKGRLLRSENIVIDLCKMDLPALHCQE